MKKAILSLSLLLSGASAFGWTHKITNTTDSAVSVTIRHGALLKKTTVSVDAFSTITKGVGPRCTYRATATKGALTGEGENEGLDCRDVEIYVNHIGKKWAQLEGGDVVVIDEGHLDVEIR